MLKLCEDLLKVTLPQNTKNSVFASKTHVLLPPLLTPPQEGQEIFWPLLRGGWIFSIPGQWGGLDSFCSSCEIFFPQNAKNYLFCMFLVVFDQYSEGGQAFFWPRVRVAGYIWPLVRGGRDFFRPLVRGAGLDVRPRPGKNSAPLDVNSGASLMSTEWAFPTKDMCWKFRTNFVVHSCFMEISNILLNKPQVTLRFVRGGDFTQPLKSKSTPS